MAPGLALANAAGIGPPGVMGFPPLPPIAAKLVAPSGDDRWLNTGVQPELVDKLHLPLETILDKVARMPRGPRMVAHRWVQHGQATCRLKQ